MRSRGKVHGRVYTSGYIEGDWFVACRAGGPFQFGVFSTDDDSRVTCKNCLRVIRSLF